MKTLKNFVNEINGLRFMVENLKLNSGIGKKFLLAQKIIVNESELKAELWNLSQLYDFVNKSENSKSIFNICNLLEHVNDIHSTIKNLHNSRVLDDVELFEIKKFCIVSQSILEELRNSDFNVLQFHDSSKIIDALDPEHSGIQSFYIYSAYNSPHGRACSWCSKREVRSQESEVRME
jgi:hypothetical protein